MNIEIKDKVGLSEIDLIEVVNSLFKNRPPKENGFNYGLETHGAIGLRFMSKLEHPIVVRQTNERKSNKCKIVIVIEKHNRII